MAGSTHWLNTGINIRDHLIYLVICVGHTNVIMCLDYVNSITTHFVQIQFSLGANNISTPFDRFSEHLYLLTIAAVVVRTVVIIAR